MKYLLWLFATALVYIVLSMTFSYEEESDPPNIKQPQDYKRPASSTRILKT